MKTIQTAHFKCATCPATATKDIPSYGVAPPGCHGPMLLAFMSERQEVEKQTTEIYWHRSKEENWDLLDELGLTDSDWANDFIYLGYEIEVTVEIDPESLTVYATKFCGVELKEKVSLL